MITTNRQSAFAAWITRHLVNRQDTYGEFADGQWGRISQHLTDQVVADHVHGHRTIGQYAVAPGDTSKWICIDVDVDDDSPQDAADATEKAAIAWHDRLIEMGFRPILEASDGAGSYHLWVVFAEPIDAAVAYDLCRWVARDWKEFGLAKIECNPKQRCLKKPTSVGNLVRCPGKHHRRDHWSMIWGGRQWLPWNESVDFLLGIDGDPAELIPEHLRDTKMSTEPLGDTKKSDDAEKVRDTKDSDDTAADPHILRRALRYVLNMPESREGHGGDHACFQVAVALVVGFSLTVRAALPIFEQWNEQRAFPEWTTAELEHKLAQADQYGGDRGYLLEDTNSPVRPYREQNATTWSIEDFQQYHESEKLASLTTPGVHVYDAPCGGGKTYSAMMAMGQAGHAVGLLATYRSCEEKASQFHDFGLPTGTLPRWSKRNCRKFDFVEKLRDSGVNPATLCSDCEFSKACTYIDMKREASRNRVVLMCQARALNSFEDVCKRGNYVLIDESFRELLAPLYKIDSADDVGKFVRLIEQAGKIATDDKRVVEWLELAKTTAETFLDRITTATEFSRIYPRRVVDDPGEPLDLVLRQALEVVVAPPADTLIALRGLLSGDLELGVDCYEKYVGRGQTATSRAIYARGRLGVPDGKIIDLSDATTSADECERLLGREVIRHCPDARLEDLHDVVQVPIETTAGTSSSARSPKGTAAKIMMGMALHPDKTRVGILGIKRHIDALRKDLNTGEFQLLPEEVWERIEMISHFGAGNDRGSNEWHTSCDMLIVIGTLRVSPEVIRAELFRSRRDDALLRDGEWDKSIRWTGKSLDGEYVVVDGMGYADRAYREVYDSLTLSTLKQAVGRSRSAVEDGVPCVCFTTEDMQLPIVPCGDLSPGAARSVLAVAELYDGAPVTPAQIEHHTERNRSQIRKELRRAVYAGWVARHDTLDGVCPSLHGSAVSRQGGALP